MRRLNVQMRTIALDICSFLLENFLVKVSFKILCMPAIGMRSVHFLEPVQRKNLEVACSSKCIPYHKDYCLW